ncbi:MAG TPA: hypothetical protein VKU36_05995 [Candidatus Babeliales bacterium]|nr:hypothetical protein [Candidatus Babeliales bacterium]
MMRRLILLTSMISVWTPLNCLLDDSISLTKLYKNSSLELSYTYPNHIITAGIKYNPSDIGVGISYNHNQQYISFQAETSVRTDLFLKRGVDLFVEQLNILADQYQPNSQIKAYIQKLRQDALIKNANTSNILQTNTSTIKDILEKQSDKKISHYLESKVIAKKIETHYGQ